MNERIETVKEAVRICALAIQSEAAGGVVTDTLRDLIIERHALVAVLHALKAAEDRRQREADRHARPALATAYNAAQADLAQARQELTELEISLVQFKKQRRVMSSFGARDRSGAVAGELADLEARGLAARDTVARLEEAQRVALNRLARAGGA